MFISTAFAQGVTGTSGFADAFASIGWIVLVIPIMYFMVIRPEQQRRKTHQAMISNVRRGDVVVTSGGIVGKVVKILEGDEVLLEIAENVRVKIIKQTLLDVRSRTDSGSDASKPANDDKK
ncbi:MAG: preprotein translocase subunit YajC [Micropepsaceae bacterium]